MTRDRNGGSDEGYQVAAIVVTTVIGLVLVFYTLIFVNPRIAFNPFKPPLPTPDSFAALPVALPPTWTPTATVLSSPTGSPSPQPTATRVIQPSPVVSAAPIFTVVLIPTATSRPPTRTSTPLVTTTPAASPTVAATATTAANLYRASLTCSHSGGTQIKGTVTSGGTPQEGVRVRVATGPDSSSIIEGGEQLTRRQPDGSAGFAFVLMPIGAFDSAATWHIWIVDGAGTPLSDPNFHFQTNNLPRDNPKACWLVVVDFTR